MAEKSKNYNYRDSETGKYVPKSYADKHPKTTEKEQKKPASPPAKQGKKK